MHIRKRYLLALLIIIVLVVWFFSLQIIKDKEDARFNVNLQQLRGVTKLVLWEQDFTLNDIESKERTYFNWLTAKESVSTNIKGKMGFDIDLADSLHTKIVRKKDTIYILAPLEITYVNLDMGSLQQVKQASIDPSVIVDKNEVIKHLDQKALEKYLPIVKAALQNKPLSVQEKQLTKLIGKPVKIVLTQMPAINNWKPLQPNQQLK
jgi:hypothetical protein